MIPRDRSNIRHGVGPEHKEANPPKGAVKPNASLQPEIGLDFPDAPAMIPTSNLDTSRPVSDRSSLPNETQRSLEGQRKDARTSMREFHEVAAHLRENAEQIATWLTEARSLPPDGAVDPSHVAALGDQVELLRYGFVLLSARDAEQDTFQQALLQEVEHLSGTIERLQSSGEPVTRTLFDTIGRVVLFATLGAVICGGLGGPAVAFILNDPVSGKVLEGAIFGGLGAAAAEVAGLIEPSERVKSPVIARPTSRESRSRWQRLAPGDYDGHDGVSHVDADNENDGVSHVDVEHETEELDHDDLPSLQSCWEEPSGNEEI
jgi:hypothetical protein